MTHEMGWDDLTVVQRRHFDRYILRSDKPQVRQAPLPDFQSWLSPLVEVPCSNRNSLIGLHQEPTLTAKSFATFRKADDMIESVIGIIVIHFNAALD
jgi:hypothetical protein